MPKDPWEGIAEPEADPWAGIAEPESPTVKQRVSGAMAAPAAAAKKIPQSMIDAAEWASRKIRDTTPEDVSKVAEFIGVPEASETILNALGMGTRGTRDFLSGISSSAGSTIGGPLRYAGEAKLPREAFSQAAKNILPESVVDLAGPSVAKGASLAGKAISTGTKKISEALDPEDPNFLDEVAKGFGSAAFYLLPGFGTARGAASLAATSPLIARAVGASVPTVLEALSEGGDAYIQEMEKPLQMSADEFEMTRIFPSPFKDSDKENQERIDRATRSAHRVFLLNLPTIAVTNMLGIFGDAGTAARRMGASMFFEGSQEAFQALYQKMGPDERNLIASYMAQGADDNTLKEMASSAAIGALVGGTFTGAGEFYRNYPAIAEAASNPGMSVLKAMPLSVQMRVQSLRYKINQALGKPQETALTPQTLAMVNASLAGMPGTAPYLQRLQEQGVSAAVLARENAWFRNEMVLQTRGAPEAPSPGEAPGGRQEPVPEPQPASQEPQGEAFEPPQVSREPETQEGAFPAATDAAPESLPEARPEGWESDPGAIPGEVAFWKGDMDKPEAVILEIDTGRADTVAYRAGLGDGTAIANPKAQEQGLPDDVFGTLQEAAEAANRALESSGETPVQTFDRGEKVQISKPDGTVLTGIVTSPAGPEDQVRVDVDQIQEAGGVPIGRVELVDPGMVQKIPEQVLTPEESGVTLREEGAPDEAGADEGEQGPAAPGVERPGEPGDAGLPTLGGVPAQEVQGVEGGGPTPGRAGEGVGSGRGRTSESGEETPDGEGVQPAPGPRGGEGSNLPAVPNPPSGKRTDTPRLNYHITEADNLGLGTPVTKYKDNVAAIRLLKKIEGEGRLATREEQKVLVKYVGWGGIKQAFDQDNEQWAARYKELKDLLTEDEYWNARSSVLNAHYTSQEVVEEMWFALQRLGYTNGRVLEPSMGIGNFFGVMPRALMKLSKLYGVELDDITGRIAKHLYQDADVKIMGFQEAKYPDQFFDVAISNVPFSEAPVADPDYRKSGMTRNLHNYFFAKSLDKVRPGGVVIFITSRYTMDSKYKTAREYISERADLIDAIRLPNTAFKGNAGTEVVTDILILRKKVPGKPYEGGKSFLEVQTQKDSKTGAEYEINEYFASNPQKMLGRPGMEGTMYARESFTLLPDGRNLKTILRQAFSELPEGIIPDRDVAMVEESAMVPAPGEMKPYAFSIHEGKVVQNREDQLIPVDLPVERTRAMVRLKDAFDGVIRSQMLNESEDKIKEAQKELTDAYNKFHKAFGRTNDKKNVSMFEDDPDYSKLMALENIDKKGNYSKADIFTKRVISPIGKVSKIETSQDALLASLDHFGKVDMAYMSKESGLSVEKIREELRGRIFEDPSMGWVEADEYLSGNVKAKLIEAQNAAELDEKYKENVEALTKALPKDVEAGDILKDIRLGAPWIPTDVIGKFIAEIAEVPERLIKVDYSPASSEWSIDIRSSYQLDNSVGNNERWGTSRYPAVRIIKDTLDGRSPKVYDRIDEKNVLNQQETAAARTKQEEIDEEFKRWVFEDAEQRDALTKIFNDVVNTHVVRSYNGSHLQLPGINPIHQMRPFQKDGIWRNITSVINNRNMGMFWAVGLGKTYAAIASGMELRRLGLRKKICYTVPKSTLPGWIRAFKYLYPNAKILVPDPQRDFTPDRRKLITGKIATGDWDAVIMTHESFARLPISKKQQEAIFREWITELEMAIEDAKRDSGKKVKVRQMETAKRRLETKLAKLLAAESKDRVADFEELGIDYLYVDESQNFKNLFYITKREQMSGLGNAEGSKRAFDMYAKIRYLTKLYGACTTFMSGTPISNTIAEMAHLSKYLQEPLMAEYGLDRFDAWANNHGVAVSKIEMAVEGGDRFVSKQRFARFVNVQEMLARFREVADVITSSDVDIARPKLIGGKPGQIISKASDWMKSYIKELGKRADDVRSGRVPPEKDNMAKICVDGRKAALDPRLIDPSLPDLPESKVNEVVRKVFETWKSTKAKRLTQAIIIDLGTPKEGFNIYDDIRQKLIALGVPKAEIAFIHSAKTEEQVNKLFDAFNDGTIRILIGSSRKMGVGVNIQQKLKKLHEVTPPFRPDEVEQAEGRILRFGNENEEVSIDRYVTENSFDTYIWQLLESKAGFLAQMKTTERSIEDSNEVVLSFEEIKAASTGNKLIIEKFKADREVKRLDLLKSNYLKSRFRAESDVRSLPGQIAGLQGLIASLKEDMDKLSPLAEQPFSAMIGDKKYDKREDWGSDVISKYREAFAEGVAGRSGIRVSLGTYKGIPVELQFNEIAVRMNLVHAGKISETPLGTVASFEHSLKKETIETRIADVQSEIDSLDKRLKDLQKIVSEPFQYEADLAAAIAKKREIDEKLGINRGDHQVLEEGKKSKTDPYEAPEPEDNSDDDVARSVGLLPAVKKGPAYSIESDMGGGGHQSIPVELGEMDYVKPLEMPELVRFIREITGDLPKLNGRLRSSNGRFVHSGGVGWVELKPSIFKDPIEAAKTVAHELGHVVDWAPEGTLARGNLVGRILLLKKFMADSYGSGVVSNKELREELIHVTEIWRPYDRNTAPAWYIAYRNSSKELYADALSVLFNNPMLLKRMAPKFYAAFFEHLDAKPNVKESYFKILDLLNGRTPELLALREKEHREMFQKAEAVTRQKFMERKNRKKNWLDRIMQDQVDRNYPVIRRVISVEDAIFGTGEEIPEEENPKYLLDELAYSENDVYHLGVLVENIIKEYLDPNGFTVEDAGILMEFQRVAGGHPDMMAEESEAEGRSKIANPLGQTPKTAQDQIEHLRKTYGDDRFGALYKAVSKLREINFSLHQRMFELGMIRPEVFFEIILPNRDNYGVFAATKYANDYVTSGIRKQIGNLGEIGNVFVFTTMKMISVLKAISVQEAKVATVKFLEARFPDEIKELKPTNPGESNPKFVAPEYHGVLTVQREGRMAGFAVDEYVAAIFDKSSTQQLGVLTTALRWTNKFWRMMLITYQPGFALLFNPVRDFFKTYKMLKGFQTNTSLAGLLKQYYMDWPAAKKYALGMPDAYVSQMINEKAIGVPSTGFQLNDEDDQLTRVFARVSSKPARPDEKRGFVYRVLAKIFRTIRIKGAALEALSKISGNKILAPAGFHGKELSFLTRNYVGTPPYRTKGISSDTRNEVLLFSTVAIQGWKTEIEIATRPRTRHGYWMAMMLTQGIPKLLMILAKLGLMGSVLKAIFDRISEYDLTNYMVIPVGTMEGGDHEYKTVYVRVPHDETSRFLFGVLWKLSMVPSGAADIQQVFSYGAGQIPNLSPTLTTFVYSWPAFLMGSNPYDFFRGRNVMTNAEYKAGGWPALKKMVMWTVNQTGWTRFATYDRSGKTWTEWALEVTPILNRLIKVSDYGLEEQTKRKVAEKESEDARINLMRSPKHRQFWMELNRLQDMKNADAITEEGQRKLNRMNRQRSIITAAQNRIEDAISRGDQEGFKKESDALDQRIESWQ